MTARKTIAKLGPNPGKQEEMDFLNAVAASLDRNTYLSSLFSKDMVKWACEQMRLDVSCDLWGALNHARERALAEGGRAMEQKKDANAMIAALKVEAMAAQERVEELRQKVKLTEEKAQLLKDRWNEALEESKQAHDETYYAQTEIDRLNGEIVMLKAKLYDLMVKEDR